jgi:hypothetical protein
MTVNRALSSLFEEHLWQLKALFYLSLSCCKWRIFAKMAP